MTSWTSHLTKLFVTGLVAAIISITFIAIYLTASISAVVPSGHIVLVDSTEQVTSKRACLAESVARLHGNVPCYLYLTSDPTPVLRQIADAYPNLYLRRWSWIPNIKDTPMEPLIKDMGVVWLNLLSIPSESRELIARAIMLWKYGGTSLSLDWRMNERESCLGDGDVPYNRVDVQATAFLRLENCHVLMEKLLVGIRSELQRGRDIDAEDMLAKIVEKFCPKTKELKEIPELCHGMKVYNGTIQCASQLPTDWDDIYYGNCPLAKSGNFKLEYFNRTTDR